MPFFPPIYPYKPRPPRRPWTERQPPKPTDEEVEAELLLSRHLEALDAATVDVTYEDQEADGGDVDDELFEDAHKDGPCEKERSA